MGWELVGRSSNPIPDDPIIVDQQVQHLRNVATIIQTQLDRIPTDGNINALVWDSAAASGFREVVKKLPKDLGALKTRYERVADVMSDFNKSLGACKADVDQGYAEAQRAGADVTTYQTGVRSMRDYSSQAQRAAEQANSAASPGARPTAPEPWTGPNYDSLLTGANKTLSNAKEKVDGAVARFRDASRAAAQAVNEANHDHLKNDSSVWGSIKKGAHWLSEHVPLEDISGLLTKISAVAGLLALIPIPLVQAVCLAVALAAAIGTALCDLVLQANKAYEHNFSWGNFALVIGIDIVGSVLSGVAVAAHGAASASAVAAKFAMGEAATAREAAAGATVIREGTAGTVAVKTANLEHLMDGSWRTVINTVLGRTGKAQTQLANAQESLDAASRAEQQAISVSAAKESVASRAEAAHEIAENATHIPDIAANSAAVAGNVNVIANEHPHTANPVSAFVWSTDQEVGSLFTWGHQGALDHAEQAGDMISPQPIP